MAAWNPEMPRLDQIQAFCYLKHRLNHTPVLTFPDFTRPFILLTHVWKMGLPAALMQENNKGRVHSITYVSKTCNKAQNNYSITELEELVVVWALKHFKESICSYPVSVYTDRRVYLGCSKTVTFQEKLPGDTSPSRNLIHSSCMGLASPMSWQMWYHAMCQPS